MIPAGVANALTDNANALTYHGAFSLVIYLICLWSNHSDKVIFVDWLEAFLVAEMNQLKCLIEEYDFIV